MRVKHKDTETWLHLDKGTNFFETWFCNDKSGDRFEILPC